MGGSITVVSAVNRGSEFTIQLPAAVTSMPEESTIDDARPSGGEATFSLEILVAEDDEINRMVIAAFLQPGGHRVTFALDGKQAVQAVQERDFDLILMDVMMPVMDSPTATRCIRKMPGDKGQTPIIALTANAMSGDRERYLAAGMNAYVSKPINRVELHRTIERTLGVRAFPRRVEPPAPAAPPPVPEPAEANDLLESVDSLLSGLGKSQPAT